jgi:release factor glutamine methyltransferase
MEVESFFYLIAEHLHQMKRVDLALKPHLEMNDSDVSKWNSILEELKIQKPIQYILGETEFYGLKFLVNEDVLIPRSETEELVDLVLKSTKGEVQNTKLNVLEIGTGSGCIPISLKKNLSNADVFAIDISKKALKIAKKNAAVNQVEITFIQADILKTNDLSELSTFNFQLPISFDIIVSNPPYVRMLEKEEIKPNVLEYEPHLALFVENHDALLFYRKIGQLAMKNLSENGMLFFEINQYMGKETADLVTDLGFKNIKLLKDIYGNDRMICCTRN